MGKRKMRMIALVFIIIISIIIYSVIYLINPSNDPYYPKFIRDYISVLTVFLISGNTKIKNYL
jgi:hypothetical protein